jgi:hypothetical protein
MRYVFLLLAWITPAHAQSYNYSEWEQLSEERRLGYIAGAIDIITHYPTGEQRSMSAMFRYRECVGKSGMNLLQLDTNVRAYVRTQPALQAQPMSTALIKYLAALCGVPLK